MRQQRDADTALMGDWEKREDEFHLRQAKTRARIRIRDGRAKPIDVLAFNIQLAGYNDTEETVMDIVDEDEGTLADAEIDIDEPWTIFERLTVEEYEELLQDISMYLSLEKSDRAKEFWQSLLIVGEDAGERIRSGRINLPESDQAPLDKAEQAAMEIDRLLSSKSYDELVQLQNQIRRKLESGEADDVEYWERFLKGVLLWKAKSKLSVMHTEILEKRLAQLREKQIRETAKASLELALHANEEGLIQDEETSGTQEMDSITREARAREAGLLYTREMSPEPLVVLDEAVELADHEILTEQEDLERIEAMRRMVVKKQFIPKKFERHEVQETKVEAEDRANALFAQEATRMMDEDEMFFQDEAAVSNQCIPGKTNIDRESRDTLIACILDTNGTSTIRLIMTPTTHRQRLFKATSLISFTRISLTGPRHQHIELKKTLRAATLLFFVLPLDLRMR